VIEVVEPLAQVLSLAPLHRNLVLLKGSEQNEKHHSVGEASIHPHFRDSCSSCGREKVLLDKEQVDCG
jgi:hypothetical protein